MILLIFAGQLHTYNFHMWWILSSHVPIWTTI